MIQQVDSDKQSETTPGISNREFEHLYRTYWKEVFTTCYRYVRDEDLAADLSQNVFEMAWKKRHMLYAGASIGGYLSRASKLEAQSYCRHAANRKLLLENTMQLRPLAANSTEERILFQELKSHIALLTKKLPSKSQEVYQLHEEGLDKKSIALSLSTSEKNVEYHLYKTLNFLRKQIKIDLK